MFTSWIVGTITPFSGTNTADKNGEQSVMIQCIAGVMPNRNVLAGTVARRAGFEIGKTYLIHVREQGYAAQSALSQTKDVLDFLENTKKELFD